MSSSSDMRVRPAVEPVRVVANERLAQGIGLLVLEAPHTARSVLPGQFVHLRIARDADFILRRPFSVHRAYEVRLEIVYQVLGRGTHALAQAERGRMMDLIGPLGTGWRVPRGLEHALLVGGGLGAAPLGMLAEQLAEAGIAVSVALGAPIEHRLVGRELFERVARRVDVATDDGSVGEQGLVTVLSERLLAEGTVGTVYACKPRREGSRAKYPSSG